MSATPLTDRPLPRTRSGHARTWFGAVRRWLRPNDAPRRADRSAPARTGPLPMYEALAIGLGCDLVGRSWRDRR